MIKIKFSTKSKNLRITQRKIQRYDIIFLVKKLQFNALPKIHGPTDFYYLVNIIISKQLFELIKPFKLRKNINETNNVYKKYIT